jgi:FeS assembly SUF system protein
MATKNLWQSMTGWMTKLGDTADFEQQPAHAAPQQPKPAAPVSLPITRSQPLGAPAASPAGEAARPVADPDPRPDEGPEINRKIIDVIKTCYDPEIPVNIYELGLIYGVNVDEEGHATVTMTLTAPNCPAAQSLPNEVRFKIEAMDEIKSANVEIVFDPPWTPNRMSDAAKLTLNIL